MRADGARGTAQVYARCSPVMTKVSRVFLTTAAEGDSGRCRRAFEAADQ